LMKNLRFIDMGRRMSHLMKPPYDNENFQGEIFPLSYDEYHI